MQSKAATVEEYLAELPEDRRAAIQTVRDVILKNLPRGYEEGMQYGMISYYVPHRLYPAGYHCDPTQPLPFTCLASQKNYMSLYLMSCYAEGEELERFQKAWAKTGKKLDMGKSCIRFKRVEDLALDVIAEEIRNMPVEKHIAQYEAATQAQRSRPSKKKAAKAKPASPPKRTHAAAKTSRAKR